MADAGRPDPGSVASAASPPDASDGTLSGRLGLDHAHDAPPPGYDAPGVAALYADLATAPWAHDFFQTMRQLEARHRTWARFGQAVRPEQEPVRLAQEPSLVFAPSTLAGWERRSGLPPRLLVHFFGVFGPNGPLPLHLTEYARDRTRNHADRTFQRFADMFHHRLLSLFYRAWANPRPTVSFDRPEDDRFGLYVGALCGLGMPTLRDRDAMPDLLKLHFAGHLSGQTRHAEGLGAILSAFFEMPVRVISFVGAWLSLPPGDVTRLGDRAETSTLGGTTVLGARVWSRQHKFRVVFGPLSLSQYLRLLPGGASFRRLIPMVRNYAGDTLVWDAKLILKRDQVPRIQLGRQGRLGWTTWLTPRRAREDAGDLCLDASADSFARVFDAQADAAPVPDTDADVDADATIPRGAVFVPLEPSSIPVSAAAMALGPIGADWLDDDADTDPFAPRSAPHPTESDA